MIINGFRGVVDFYVCRGIPCARMWPRKPRGPRSPDVQLQNQVFKRAATLFPQISLEIREAYQAMAGSTELTWKDMFYRGYLSGTLKYFYKVDEIEES